MKRSNVRRTRSLGVEQLQARQLMAADLVGLARPGGMSTYSIDGTGNNVAQVEWGSTNEDLVRLARSVFDANTGTSTTNPRQQVNTITS